MGLWADFKREFSYIRNSRHVLAAVKDVDAASENLLTDDIEKAVDRFSARPAFFGDERQWSYAEFDAYANQVAHWAQSRGCKPGDTAALFVSNRLEYVALWYGLSKVGVIPALINFNLRAKALAHCVNISSAKLCIIDHDLLRDWQSCEEFLEGAPSALCAFGTARGYDSFEDELSAMSTKRPARSVRAGIKAGDMFMKMFTSGTTGMPKAAKITHTRAQYYFRGFATAARCTPDDRVLMVLPLYHATGGLCGVGMALSYGGSVIVRPKFSVSSFWNEATEYGATIMIYVGELCRFLLLAPPHPKERAHKLRYIVGNGLGRDVWEDFVKRFNIPNVMEFYGATEGNISLINLGGPAGSVGRIPDYMRKKINGDLIKYDVETDTHIKGPDGFYQRTDVGEIGELIGEIRPGETRFRYDGYEDKQASNKKILRNVYVKGDMWFRTGDLLWRDEHGYYFFADRMGDTYRWKAENVSTGEVAAALSSFDGVQQANVYGVTIPGYDGRAGMASLVCSAGVDLKALHAHTQNALPAYAQPVFLRVSAETDTTSTFKFRKSNLVKQGFDPAIIKDGLYVDHPDTGAYEKLTSAIFKQIQQGKLKF